MMMNRAVLQCAAIMAALSLPVLAQNPQYQPQPSYQQQEPLSNLVAPIALYPDLLLSQVLAASTYPAEITQAQQWMQSNPSLRGRDLVEAAKQQNWDPSVQALVAFPDVVNMLTRDIQWTTDLGNAFLSNQAGVMDAIQQLRASARDNGRLTNTPQERVTTEQENGQSAIVIQPTDPQVVYPPIYNPEYVWGPPAYGAYPPLGYPGVGYGIAYGVATFLGTLFTGLLSFGGWGWGLGWLTHGLFLNGLFFSHFGFHGYGGYGFHAGSPYSRAAWVHDPSHRMGVPYGNHYAGGFNSQHAGFSSQHAGFNSQHAGFNSQRYANYSGRSYSAGNYTGGSSRQMEAYRGLTASRGLNASTYRGGGSGYSPSRSPAPSSHYSAPSPHYSAQAPRYSAQASHYSAPRASRGSSPAHYSAPKSGHSGGGGHSSGGHGHSGGGGGHSHGGSHKK